MRINVNKGRLNANEKGGKLMYKKVLSPINIGKMEVKNRFVMPAMDSLTTTEDNKFSEQSIQYFAAKAKGGFGLIISEFLCVDRGGLSTPKQAAIFDDSFIPNLKQLTDEIHKYGAKCLGQLEHAGIQTSQACLGGNLAVGPSAVPHAKFGEKNRALTNEEVYEMIHKFGDAAVRAKKAGFDGVEIHGAHGYLISQFFSKVFNKRSDEFGGSAENRARFACEVIKEIKKRCEEDYPVTIRINGSDYIEGSNTLEDIVAYAKLVEAAGVDAIHVSCGTAVNGYIVTPYFEQPGFNIDRAYAVKQAVSIPVIAVGRINSPALAEAIVAGGKADMISLGRQSIADPEFPNKVAEGRVDEIFQCTGCMQRCYYTPGCDEDDKGISCMINPFSGKEYSWSITPAPEKKNIIVVGAGPAGLEAAWVLARRGHAVKIYEKEDMVGGQYNLAAVSPFKQDVAKTIYTYKILCDKYGVEIKYGVEVNEAVLQNEKADAIILATGSKPLVPPIPGIDSPEIIKANDLLAGKAVLSNKKVLIAGGGIVGCEVAEHLLQYGNSITMIDMIKDFAAGLCKVPRKVLLQRLGNSNVTMLNESKVLKFKKDGVEYEHDGEIKVLDGYDAVVLAMGSRSHNPLEETVKKFYDSVYVIGDAKQVRDAKYAIYEGAKLAMHL